MKIQFFAYSNGNFLNGQNHINNLNKNVTLPQSLNNNNVDSFTKSTKEVSFHGVEKKNKTKDVLSDLAAIGIIGAPFVLSIGAGCYVMNKMNPKDIFLPDGTYFMSTEQMKTPVITADTDEGILKIEGTPIDIDASKYDIADIEHGIFKNFDGSVDIDLANNKYIDMDKGVIIDPEHNLSFIKDASGEIHNLVLPDLNSPNFEGASIGTVNPVHLRQTREEYINQHHSKPEDDLSNIYSDNNRIPNSASDRVVEPDDNRNLAQKIMDFFNPLSPDSRVNNLFDRSKNYDVFGREILTISKPDGSISKVAIDEDLKAVLEKTEIKLKSFGPESLLNLKSSYLNSLNEKITRLIFDRLTFSKAQTDSFLHRLQDHDPKFKLNSFELTINELEKRLEFTVNDEVYGHATVKKLDEVLDELEK